MIRVFYSTQGRVPWLSSLENINTVLFVNIIEELTESNTTCIRYPLEIYYKPYMVMVEYLVGARFFDEGLTE